MRPCGFIVGSRIFRWSSCSRLHVFLRLPMSNLFKVTKFSYFFGPPSCFFQKYAYLCNPLHRKDEAGEIKFDFGEMAEWSNAAVLKTVDLNGSGGSNPSLSAKKVAYRHL